MKASLYRHRSIDDIPVSALKRSLWNVIESEIRRSQRSVWSWGLFPAAIASTMVFILIFNLTNQKNPSFDLVVEAQENSERLSFKIEDLSGDISSDILSNIETLKNSLSVSPEIDFDLLNVSSTSIKILLKEDPEPNVTYMFMISRDSKENFQWTYEVPNPEEENREDTDATEEENTGSVGMEESEDGDGAAENNDNNGDMAEESDSVEVKVEAEEEAASQDNGAIETSNVQEEKSEVDAGKKGETNEEVIQNQASEADSEQTAGALAETGDLSTEFSTAVSEVPSPSAEITLEADVCVVDLKSFSDAIFISSSYSATEDHGFFLVQEDGIFDAGTTFGHQIIVLMDGDVFNAGTGGVYYLHPGAFLQAFGNFTAYVKKNATLVGQGNGGTIYYEKGAKIEGFGPGTVYKECSKISFVRS